MDEENNRKKLELEVSQNMKWDDVNDVWNKVALFFKENDKIEEVKLSVDGVSNIDSLSLNYLVMLRGFAMERGGDFVLTDVNDALYRVFEMMQLNRKFTIIRKEGEE